MNRAWALGISLLMGCEGDRRTQGSVSSSPEPTASSVASAAESAAAPPPPVDASVLTVEKADEAANASTDTLSDKKIKVAGVVAKVIKQTAGKNATHAVKLVPSKAQTLPVVYCDIGKLDPAGIEEGATITVEGTGRLTGVKSKDGTSKKRLELRECRKI
jgi:hypothetical protein